MKTILVTASTPVEISFLIRETGAMERVAKGVPAICECELSGQKVFLATTGLGKVNAASCTASLIYGFLRYHY
jgi:nucleoside phosphorylase